MKPSLSDVLPLLNASCGDVLKAALLHEFFPELPKINPMWLKNPSGDVEAAFAALKAARPEPSRAEELVTAIKADHQKIVDLREQRFVDPTIRKLVQENTTAKPVSPMPTEIRYDDVTEDELQIAKPQEPASAELITLEEAMREFGYSYGGILARLKSDGLEGVRIPGKGKAKFFPRARVAQLCVSKGKHVK